LDERIMASSLILDFNGPAVFYFSADQVQGFIPICDGHTCNVLTDSNDVSPDQDNTFTLSGPTGARQTQPPMGKKILILDPKILTGPLPGQQKCYCIFQLPLPDNILGLRAQCVGITTDKGQDLTDNYARGVRFYYSACPNVPTITPANPPELSNIDPTSVQPSLGPGPNYKIEIRYHDTNQQEPSPHADAKKCSKNMRDLFPPLDRWTVDFSTPCPQKVSRRLAGARPARATLVGPGGVDCLANGFVFNAGGIAP